MAQYSPCYSLDCSGHRVARHPVAQTTSHSLKQSVSWPSPSSVRSLLVSLCGTASSPPTPVQVCLHQRPLPSREVDHSSVQASPAWLSSRPAGVGLPSPPFPSLRSPTCRRASPSHQAVLVTRQLHHQCTQQRHPSAASPDTTYLTYNLCPP